MSNLVIHAQEELKRAGLFDKDSDYGGMLGEAVLEIVELFSKQGHSGMSAAMVTSIAEKLMRFEPLTPLTGDDDEWVDVGEMMGKPLWQNKRCSHVFKDETGAYDQEGRIFYPKGERAQTFVKGGDSGSRVKITFPYTPKREYVEETE